MLASTHHHQWVTPTLCLALKGFGPLPCIQPYPLHCSARKASNPLSAIAFSHHLIRLALRVVDGIRLGEISARVWTTLQCCLDC